MLTGFAKQAFFDTYQRSPWKQSSKVKKSIWPQLEAYVSEKRISYLDYMLTYKLLTDYPQIDQGVAFFICHLILAARNGHLCVRLNGENIEPSPHQLWQGEEIQLLTEKEIQQLNEWLLIGLKQIPSSLITDVSNNQSKHPPTTPLCRFFDFIYLQRHWVFESLFLINLKRLLTSQTKVQFNADAIKASALDLYQKNLVLEEQAQVIIQGCLCPLSLITGGPGTGKTYTAAYLIKVFWDNLSVEERKKSKIILAAPTGKAAANLQNSLNRVMTSLKDFQPLEAKTLHAWLGIKMRQATGQDKPRLSADIILVDESSMIDVKLMATLFEAVQTGSRLILMGDPCQLPSVEAGSVFSDLIDLNSQGENVIPATQLKTCLRSELKSIIDLASIVNEGNAEKAITMLHQGFQSGVKLIPLPEDRREASRILLRHVSALFPSGIQSDIEPQVILNIFNRIRLLSPMRKGSFGVDALNQLLGDYFIKSKEEKEWIAIPIIVTTNDYRQRLFNGETGVLMRKLSSKGGFQAEDYALFPSRETNQYEVRKIPALLLPKYEYAYCLSVHKSQGSEFDQVVLIMPEGAELFGREVFYTGITRARKQLDIVGSEAVLYKTIRQKGIRLSGIAQRYKTV